MGVNIPGPEPKPGRARNNKDNYSPTKILYRDGVRRGPELDPSYNWSDKTLRWWEEWRNAPQAQLMEDTDWRVLEKAALLYDMLWTGQCKPAEAASLSKEIDRICSNYGLTYTDRLKMRIRIEDEPLISGEQAKRGSVKVSDYRRLVGI